MKKIVIIITISLFGTGVTAQSIFRTACQGNLHRLDSLLQYDSINIQDNRGRSLLHWAIACNKNKVFQFLVENGINIDQQDNENKTPLYVAVHFDKEEYFDLLFDLQRNNTWVEKYGTALLERAVLNRSELFVKKLVECGVDVDNKNERGSTPLEISNRIDANEISQILLSLGADESNIRTSTIKGKYMGLKPPGLTSIMLAPNFISTEEAEFGSVFNSTGTEFYYGVDVNGKSEIRYTELVNDQWTEPTVFLSHERYGYNDPFLSNDEDRLYFISKRAFDGIGNLKDVDIWYVQKEEEGWSEPINAGLNINSEGNEYYISFTNDGTLYFSSNVNASEESKGSDYDIYYSKYIDGEFRKPVVLNESINTEDYEADVFISPDESYIIFCSTRESGFGQGDLYISFKNSDDSWSKAINMGKEINTQHYEYCPFVTKNGKYLLYTSSQDIYWISMEIVEELRKKNR